MNTKLRGLMAAAVIGGASLTGAATVADAAPATPKTVVVKKIAAKPADLRRTSPVQAHRIAQQIRRLTVERRSLLAKLRALSSHRVVATQLSHRDCRVVSTRAFRMKLAQAVRTGRISRVRARQLLVEANHKSARCQIVLRREIRRTSAQIARLQRLYASLIRRRV